MYDAYTPGKKPNSFLTWWSAKMLIVGSVGLTQATILYFIMTRVIDLTAKSNINLFLLLIVGSLTFLSIIFCLRILLGGFGTWLITIILVLQLSASSGLYPIQLTSHFASSLTPFLPMTYLIDGLRHAISLGGSIGTDLYVMFFVILLTQMLILIKFFISVRTNKFSFMNSVALKDKMKNNG
ncbi:YhgE/Pip family protein [Lactiplantibacillus plantarum]|uniref:YhgE/Pip family protein n=1 Tax=Lactiplantibacillus plantarum TaxID=1590 RepID=UPI003F53A5C5